MTAELTYKESGDVCPKCHEQIWIEHLISEKMVRGILKTKDVITGWQLCGCQFQHVAEQKS